MEGRRLNALVLKTSKGESLSGFESLSAIVGVVQWVRMPACAGSRVRVPSLPPHNIP